MTFAVDWALKTQSYLDVKAHLYLSIYPGTREYRPTCIGSLEPRIYPPKEAKWMQLTPSVASSLVLEMFMTDILAHLAELKVNELPATINQTRCRGQSEARSQYFVLP